jgi:protein-S-isoprenylcysteine O-methyltransferase Ste14
VGIGWRLLSYLLCLFVPAGTLARFRGWLFFFVLVGTITLAFLYLRRVNPEVITARISRHKGTKLWDLVLMGIFYPTVMAVVVLAALDDGRFHWFPLPWWVCGLGYVVFITGIAGLTWAESVNKFFERTVRIQTDRGHRVIDTGPYAMIRHPGYLSACLIVVGMSLALGSAWALLPAVSACMVLIVRTMLEDRTLRAELAGYKEYAGRVRYRLVPGVW